MFNSFSHPREVIDVLTESMFGVSVDMLSDDMKIIVMTTSVIDLKLVVGVAYAVDVLSDVLTVLILLVGVVSAIDVDMLADENVNGLEFTLAAP